MNERWRRTGFPSGKWLLTPEQALIVRQLAAEGLRRDDIAKRIGVTPFVLSQRMRDQLGGLQLKRGRKCSIEDADPTPEEVELRKIEVRAKWSRERWFRGSAPEDGPRFGRVTHLDAVDMDDDR